ADILSCSTTTLDTCCSPKHGLLVLAQQWVPGKGPRDAFTMHGLWPDTCSGAQVPIRECDASRSYNGLDNILYNYDYDQLYDNMTTYWPSEGRSNNWFWTHEWQKHGICVSTLAPKCYGSEYKRYQDVHDYFEQALDLRTEYDLYAALDSAGIQPGSNPDDSEIHSAIRAAFGEDAMLQCDPHGDIREIRLYFHVKGKSQYVLTAPLETGSCQGSVGYPEKY
ncbi:ribonuclease T2-like protein, partial [Jimgerdemannia flammicorona]